MPAYTMVSGQRKRVNFTPFDLTFLGGPLFPGNVFWVGSTASPNADNAGAGSKETPFATLAFALTQAVASRGDTILLLPGHAETTTAIAMSTAGVKVIGLGVGRNRPTLTATTAATDLVNVTAANVSLENIRLIGAASGVTALLDLSSAADDFYGVNLSFEQAATPLDAVTISSDRWVLEDCVWLGTANGPDRCISIEAKSDNWRLIRPRFLYPLGVDNELIKSTKVCVGYLIEDVFAVGVDTLIVNFSSSSAGPPDGFFASGQVMYSAPVASIEDGVAAATSKGMSFGTLRATDTTGVRSGAIPLTSAS